MHLIVMPWYMTCAFDCVTVGDKICFDGSQIISLGVIPFVGYFADPAVNNVPVGLWSMAGLVALACFITLFVRPELSRVKIDSK